MQLLDNNIQAFLVLVRAGLWETEVQLSQFNDIDFSQVLRLAEEQSVVGLVAAGLENVVNVKVPKEDVLKFVGQTLQLEQRNQAMNVFVAKLIDQLRSQDIYALLVKGQGVAQCYERPLWRSSGDVDLLLSDNNYKKAKASLMPIASEVANEDEATKHQALVINGFDVELHGKMPFEISKRVDKGIDEVLNGVFCGGSIRSWDCNGTQVFLPSPDNDVVLVFTHFLHHFFIEGVGLRQICDWCRVLWTYKDSLNYDLLESRIRNMGLMTEWKTFASLAINTLGMPKDSMPLYDNNPKFNKKAERALNHILKCGNMGHNNDLSYRVKYKGLAYKMVSLWRRLFDFVGFSFIFPVDAPTFFVTYVFDRIKAR